VIEVGAEVVGCLSSRVLGLEKATLEIIRKSVSLSVLFDVFVRTIFGRAQDIFESLLVYFGPLRPLTNAAFVHQILINQND
jgi:hypothetical protein